LIILLFICLYDDAFFQSVQEVKVLQHLLLDLLVESCDEDQRHAAGDHRKVDAYDSHYLCGNFSLIQFRSICIWEPNEENHNANYIDEYQVWHEVDEEDHR